MTANELASNYRWSPQKSSHDLTASEESEDDAPPPAASLVGLSTTSPFLDVGLTPSFHRQASISSPRRQAVKTKDRIQAGLFPFHGGIRSARKYCNECIGKKAGVPEV
jgi:hypothetical protein